MDNSLENLFKQMNPWWEDSEFQYNLIDRDFYLNKLADKKTDLIDILIGARRVGKTFILKSVINSLTKSNVARKKILFLSCDAREIKELGIKKVIDTYIEINKFKSSDRLYIFLDEIQEIKDWQPDIKYFVDTINIKFYLTGSSSLILANQTSKLTGRFILNHVLPLSFNEYLKFTKQKLKVKEELNIKLVEDYLETGGYPRYVLTRDRQYIIDAIESTLYRELLEHYGLRNPSFLRSLLEYLSDKVTSNVSAKRIQDDLKVTDETAKFYLQYLQDIYLIFPVFRYGKSFGISKSSIPKYYFNDTGVLKISSISPRIGFLAENAVFLHLLRRSESKQNLRIFYNNFENVEVDFQTQDSMYEVKYRTELDKVDLEKYQSIDKEIKFIVKETNDEFYNILPQHKQVPLWKFLSED
jgi:predicted AAA+ superfamily ATPase